jgi:hypothetical protein
VAGDDDWNNLTPEQHEQLEAILGRGQAGEESEVIKDQIAKALAMRQPQAGKHTTGLGAFFGAIGDVGRAGQSAYYSNKANTRQKQMIAARQAGLKAMQQMAHGKGAPASQPGEWDSYAPSAGGGNSPPPLVDAPEAPPLPQATGPHDMPAPTEASQSYGPSSPTLEQWRAMEAPQASMSESMSGDAPYHPDAGTAAKLTDAYPSLMDPDFLSSIGF